MSEACTDDDHKTLWVFRLKIVCDNDCGSLQCMICHRYFYMENNQLISGHSPKCEVFSLSPRISSTSTYNEYTEFVKTH